jgi:VWFA-related protein
MIRPVIASSILATGALVLLAATTGGQETVQPPVFGVELDIVRLDVVVLDDEGRPVPDLTAADFVIEENGEPREVVSFEPVVVRPRPTAPDDPTRISANRLRSPAEGRSIVVLFDDIHVTPVETEFVRDALVRFIREELNDGDWLTILSPGQSLRWMGRTAWEHEQMVPFVERLQGQLVRDPTQAGISDWEAVRINEYGISGLASAGLSDMSGDSVSSAGAPADAGPPPGTPGTGGGSGLVPARDESVMGVGKRDLSFISEEVTATARRRIEASLSGLRQALESLVGVRGHKSLVLVSEGFVLLPKMPGYRDLIDLARRANVAIHYLDPRTLESGFGAEASGAGPAGPTGTLRMLESIGADDVSAATGGRALVSNDPLEGLQQVAREAQAYYLVGFQPQRPETGLQEVRVHTTREDLSVRSRTRYVAGPSPTPETSDKKRRAGAMRSIAETSDLPLRVATLFFEDNGKGKVTTMYATEIRYPAGTEGQRKVKTIAEAWPRDAGKPLRDEFDEKLDVRSGVPTILSRHWHMPPGVWQIRILVEDEETGRVGTALHTFHVPSPEAFRLSTPILTSELEEVDGAPRPRVVLNRTFRAGQVLYCQVQVHGAADHPQEKLPHVRSGYELRMGDTVVRSAEPTRIRPEWDGRLSRLMGLSLEGAPTGHYTLVLSAEDELTGRTLTASEPFTVLP